MSTTAERASGEALLPDWVQPMLARGADGPLDSEDMAYEVKWDGMRALCGVRGVGAAAKVELRARSGLEATSRFPELQSIRSAIALPEAVLDGEIIRLEEGKPNFQALQRRIQATNPLSIASLAEAEPCTYMVFDLLRAGTDWLLDLPWRERRGQLEKVFHPVDGVLLSPVWDDGVALWEAVRKLELEGVMAKRRDGHYLTSRSGGSGRRGPEWLKIKAVSTLDLVVGGWTDGIGGRSGSLGALLVGFPAAEHLQYLGHVGTGFDALTLVDSLKLLRPLESAVCPFQPAPRPNAPVHWTRPDAVCEVRHQGWSADGHLRAPVFLRWRPDKVPSQCVRPESAFGIGGRPGFQVKTEFRARPESGHDKQIPDPQARIPAVRVVGS